MTTFTKDPKFTAYALGEMNEAEAVLYREELLAGGIDQVLIQREVDDLIDFQRRLSDEFSKDESLRLNYDQREGILRKGSSSTFGFIPRWLLPLAATGMVAVIVAVNLKEVSNSGIVGSDQYRAKRVAAPKARQKPKISKRVEKKAESISDTTQSMEEVELEADFSDSESVQAPALQQVARGRSENKTTWGAGKGGLNSRAAKKMLVSPTSSSFIGGISPEPSIINREGYDHIESSTYVTVSAEPLSTFSIDVDTASYANVRRFIDGGKLPPKHAVRVEELINYFPYAYKMDKNDHPIAVKVDQAPSPFHRGRRLVRVAMKASMPETSVGKNLVFLLDVSGSMNSQNKLPLLKESLKIVMRELRPTDTISLVVYAGAAGVVLKPTPVRDRLKIRNALNRLNAGGSTNGGAGIEAAYKLAKEAFIKGGVNRVILATDGDFNVGTSHRGGLVDLVKEKAKENIFLTVLGFGMGNYQDAMLEEISNKGNGNYAYIDNLSEANKVFKHDLEKNMTTVAKDVKLQVEFNPKFVQAYRLIGYENRKLAAKDFNDDKKDAGEIGAGHTVTALYEIIGNEERMPLAKVDALKYGAKKPVVKNDSNEILNVKVRYKKPTGSVSTKFEVPLVNKKLSSLKADQEMQFATSVAAWGLKLRGDEMAKNLSYKKIRKMAHDSRGKDELGLRSEFLDLVDFTIGLSR